MITTSIGTVQDIIDNEHLLLEHWDEIVIDKGRKLDVHWDFFRQIEQINGCIVILAKEGEKVVGYAGFILQYHLHSKTTLTGHNDAIFVQKEHRGRAGLKLIKAAEDALIARGVNMIFWHVKPANDFGPVLKHLGYDFHESIYIKHVGKA